MGWGKDKRTDEEVIKDAFEEFKNKVGRLPDPNEAEDIENGSTDSKESEA